MNKQQLEKRLEVTNKAIDLFEKAIEQAPNQKESMHPSIYRAMVKGYKGERDRLKEEAKQYQQELNLINE